MIYEYCFSILYTNTIILKRFNILHIEQKQNQQLLLK